MVSLYAMGEQLLADMVHIIILARVWRFARIAHGLLTSMHEIDHHHTHVLEESIEELEDEMATMLAYTTRLEANVGKEVAQSVRVEAELANPPRERRAEGKV